MEDLGVTASVSMSTENVERAFDRVGDKAAQMANKVAKEAEKAGAATDNMGAGAEKSAEKFTRAESRMRSAIQKSTRELEMLGKTASQKFEAQLDFKGLDKAKFQPFLDELRKAEEATKKAESGLSGLGSAAQAAGRAMAVAFSGAAAFGVVGKLVEVQREFDVLNSSLKTVTGSSAAAERELSWLKTFAKETPFGLAQATQGFVKMKALGLDPTRAALTSFGNTASAMGKDLNQMIEAVADASTGEFERLKEFGIKAKKEGDNVSLTFQGVTTTIKNSAEEITKYLENIGNNQFGGAMAERAKTLDGAISELGDTWDELFRTINERNAGTLIYDSIKLVNGAIEDATAIIKAMTAAYDESGQATGAMATIQNGIATVFETVAVLGANLKYVLVQIGTEIGGLAAQVAQAAQFNFAGVAAIREQMVADAEEARKQIDLTEKRILGARKAQEEYARYATRNASAATDPRRIDLGASSAPAAATRAGTRATKEALSEYDKLMQRLGVDLPKAAAAAEAAQHGYNKAQEEFIALAGSAVWAGFTNQQRAQVAALFENKIASEQSADAAKTLAKAAAESSKALGAWYEVREKESQGLQNQINARREEVSMMGMTTEAVIEYTRAKFEQQAAEKEAYAAALESASFYAGEYAEAYKTAAEAARQQAQQLRELGGLEVEKANKDAAKKAKDEWERAAADIERALTDSLMRGFESGKDFAKNLRDTVSNMFRTLVLRPIISAAMSPVAGAINGMLYGNAAAAAGGGANALGMLGSGANLINGLQGTQGMLGTVGGWLGLNTAAANAGLAATIGIDAASAAAAANAAGAAGGGLLSGVGAALPWIGGIAALASILGGLDDSGTLHTGGAAQYNAATGLRTSLGFRDNEEGLPSYNPRDNIDNQFGTGFGYVERGDQTIDAVSNLARGLGTALDGVAVAFGQRAGYEIATAFADDSSGDGAWGALRISREGQDLLNWENNRQSRWAPREFGDGEEGYKQYLAAVAKDTRQVLLDMDLPSWADKMLESIGESASMEQLTGVLTQIGVVQSAFVALGNSMAMFSGLSDDMQSALLKAAGSIDALTTGAGAFYQGFYSEQERFDALSKQLKEALGGLDLSIDPRMGDDAKEQFRAAVEAAFAAGDAELAAGLLSISGNFATAADYFEQLSQSAAQAAEQAAQVAERPAAEQASIASDLRRQILELTGDTAAIRQLEIAGMNAANVALYDRVQALQAEAQQNAIRADLDRQVLELTGDTAAIRQLEIAGMDAVNVALYDRIQALQAEAQAAEQAAQAAAEQASIGENLQRQLIQLTGDTAAIRQLEIAGMDAANVALYDRVQALQAEQQAAAEAQRAAEQAAQAQQRTAETMQRLQVELYRAQGDNLSVVAIERERELAALAQFGPAAVAMQQQIYGLIDAMAASNAAAASYFAGIDRAAAEQGYNDQAQSAIDALFGSVSDAAQAAAQGAADAAKSAAASWRSAASSIQSSLEKLRASTTSLSDPASRYAETKSVLDEYTRLALGGDASAAEKLAGAADAFLSASESGTTTQAEYLRDRVLTEAKLASVMESSEAQASLQESIATAANAAVSELQTLNNNLTGFAGDLYDLLRSSSYSGIGRDGATGIAATFAKMQADFEAYFSDNARFAVGSQYSDPSFGGASFTKLDNNIAQFTGAEGAVSYLRAGESLLDVAKRIPELRKLWEQSYNVSLPAFAVGTNYVPRDMTARIHEGEAIVPKAFNPWANGGGSTGGDNAEVVAELRAVTAQLVKLEARLAEIEKTNDQMAQQQDNGTDGGNAYRAEIMNVDALAQAIKEATV